MKLRNRFMLLGLTAAVTGGFVISQIYMHEKNRKELREIAQELAANWRIKLGLTKAQCTLLEDILIEYTIRKNEVINSELTESRKISRLQEIQKHEHNRLRKIFTEAQFNEYVGINKKIPNEIMDS
ncbi:hypothetical protein L1I30_07320 [Gillisia sp. M10.2A]|uniref:Uncharacterized protein n=1 Tax=Gillisia lutea TaxID=2909668 RepID=A0ABS9EH42_9FLAO|nr:hypothetical protein [Gillisia lutea]MCF4101469.1 hypothetical protein [Gillisia lutea]